MQLNTTVEDCDFQPCDSLLGLGEVTAAQGLELLPLHLLILMLFSQAGLPRGGWGCSPSHCHRDNPPDRPELSVGRVAEKMYKNSGCKPMLASTYPALPVQPHLLITPFSAL